MLLRTILASVPTRSEAERAALAVHSSMLEHGFLCVGTDEPGSAAEPVLQGSADGGATLQILPPGWNARADCYTFGYIHPLREGQDSFTVKALPLGGQLVVHAASSAPGGDLLTVNLDVPGDASAAADAVEARAKAWQEKVTMTVVSKLLQRQNSTARLAKALEQAETQEAPKPSSSTKRPAPDSDDPMRSDPFSPTFPSPFGGAPLIWTPDRGMGGAGGLGGGGMLVGPRHPAWGQVLPGRSGGGMMPRFSPVGPGGGEPDPDHARVPGFRGDGVPDFPGGGFPGGFPGGPGRGGRGGPGGFDPDGMFG